MKGKRTLRKGWANAGRDRDWEFAEEALRLEAVRRMVDGVAARVERAR
jgi:hypothetical protein